MNIPCPSIPHGGLKSTLGGDSLGPCICPAPLGSSSKIDGREADENAEFILTVFSFTPAVGTPLSTGWTPPPECFLWWGRAVRWAFLAQSLVGGGTLVGAPPFGRRIVLTLVGLPDAVIADGVGGPPDFTSKAASETPNECTELGQVFLFSGTYHCRHAMDDPWGAGAEEEEGGWPASIGIPPDEYKSCGGNVGPG